MTAQVSTSAEISPKNGHEKKPVKILDLFL